MCYLNNCTFLIINVSVFIFTAMYSGEVLYFEVKNSFFYHLKKHNVYITIKLMTEKYQINIIE